MPTRSTIIDSIDPGILAALNEDPRATVIALADKTGLSRNTVQTRLGKLEKQASCALSNDESIRRRSGTR